MKYIEYGDIVYIKRWYERSGNVYKYVDYISAYHNREGLGWGAKGVVEDHDNRRFAFSTYKIKLYNPEKHEIRRYSLLSKVVRIKRKYI